jgi:hypothetical protein
LREHCACELYALAALATLAQISTRSAAHF